MKHSSLQLNILSKTKTTNYNICISATAGSGKTTMLVEILKIIKSFEKTLFLAFNKSIVKELDSRVKIYKNVSCMTLHSFGYGQLYKLNRKLELKEYKSYIFADKLVRELKLKRNIEEVFKWNLVRLYDLYRMNYKTDLSSVVQLAEYYDIQLVGKELEVFSDYFNKIQEYNLSSKETLMVDFTDMIYLPLFFELPITTYQNVLVDELQDLNEAQRLLVIKILGKRGRFFGVGDPNQSVYSFAGADVYSFEKFKNLPNTINLPLSISYRCPKNIVNKAREIYQDIEPFDEAREGVVREAKELSDLYDGDFVLCRNNAPLMFMYLNLLKKGVKSYIKGSDMGEQLVKLCSKLSSLSVKEGLEALKSMLNDILQDLIQKEHPSPRNATRYTSFNEKIQIIEFLSEGKFYMDEIIDNLKIIYKEDGKGVVLMTIHKSKGLETDNVYIIRPDLLGGNPKYVNKPWQIIQEENLKFVAFTRSKLSLTFVSTKVFNDEKKIFVYLESKTQMC